MEFNQILEKIAVLEREIAALKKEIEILRGLVLDEKV